MNSSQFLKGGIVGRVFEHVGHAVVGGVRSGIGVAGPFLGVEGPGLGDDVADFVRIDAEFDPRG